MASSTTADGSVVRTAERGQMTMAVVTAVADAKGVSPKELDAKLHDVVDPDGLEAIFGTGDTSSPSAARLVLSMADCEVVVYDNEQVIVTPPVESTEDEDGSAPTGSEFRHD
ncbi:HalOD1 output domain-containing protein [Haladaptatus cibarius]|uniref:HalOD1 output domain-containing protein n=1 Tax=Haladaptatus cibarius TaxID=453847 RepID=UPI0006793832|nr:HalOD1 output domain-containing protein [Haladaptatus cibarius]